MPFFVHCTAKASVSVEQLGGHSKSAIVEKLVNHMICASKKSSRSSTLPCILRLISWQLGCIKACSWVCKSICLQISNMHNQTTQHRNLMNIWTFTISRCTDLIRSSKQPPQQAVIRPELANIASLMVSHSKNN